MTEIIKLSKRIGVIWNLTFKEAIRRRMIILLTAICFLYLFSGGACGKLSLMCNQPATDSQIQQEVNKYERHINKQKIPDEQKRQIIAKFKGEALAKSRQGRKDQGKQGKFKMFILSYSMMGFWLYLCATVFTPFLMMNDFQSRTHVVILARPVPRWAYLFGKFSSIMTVFLGYFAIILLCTFAFLYFNVGDPGFELLKGALIFLQGLALYTSLLVMLSLLMGRIPAIFMSVVIVALGVVPAVVLLTGKEAMFEAPYNYIFVYGLGYGLPQFGVNFLFGLGETLNIPGMESSNMLKSAGNYIGLYSLLINTGWMILFWAVSIFTLNQKELET